VSPDTVLAIVVLGPPAAFGVLIAFEEWRDAVRARRNPGRADLLAEYVRRRHPASRPRGPEDDPQWEQP
jgi:hypothetical protein